MYRGVYKNVVLRDVRGSFTGKHEQRGVGYGNAA